MRPLPGDIAPDPDKTCDGDRTGNPPATQPPTQAGAERLAFLTAFAKNSSGVAKPGPGAEAADMFLSAEDGLPG